jgi:integrase
VLQGHRDATGFWTTYGPESYRRLARGGNRIMPLRFPQSLARLGHADPGITTRIYARAVRAADGQAAHTMQQILATGR